MARAQTLQCSSHTRAHVSWGRAAIILSLTCGVATIVPSARAQPTPKSHVHSDARVELWVQPGMTSADFLSAPSTDPSTTGFNFRVSTVVQTGSRWLVPVVGVNLTPYGSSGSSRRNTNEPSLFLGTIVSILPARVLGGWLQLDLPILMTHTPGGGGDNNPRRYGRDVVVETAATLFLGEKIFHEFGKPFSSLRLYANVGQVLTPNVGSDGTRDRLNPVAYYGVTIPIGTSGRNER